MQTSTQAFVKANQLLDDTESSAILVAYKPIVHSKGSILLKRSVDIIFSLLLLVLLVPTLFPIIAVLVFLDSKGSVFYIQDRTGCKKKIFRCYKIRTMYRVEKHGKQSLHISRLGMFLRRSHIDELPQLLNVLRGEMSLVGPRPHMISDTQDFETRIPNYHLRHAVRPGITGLAQVNGFYGSVHDIEHLKKRVQHDIEYVYTWHFMGDLLIMIRTIRESVARKN